MTAKDIIGTIITSIGVVWVSLAKGEVLISEESLQLSEETRTIYKIISISLSIFVGCLTALIS